jgi:NADH-quinone oxidoreductase subunit E
MAKRQATTALPYNCDKGPTLMINEDTHGPVSIEQISSLLEQYP